MCGIAGSINFNSGSVSESFLLEMRETLSHRGPDDEGFYLNEVKSAGFVHKRLSIIDPSPAGRQPMWNDNKSLCITFNGEIYNYRDLREELKKMGHSFKSDSDTETIIHVYEEWGIEVLLDKLRGMFAFAIYDARESRLIIARDRLGIKPVYYYYKSGTIVFASEIKAILKSELVSKKINYKAAELFLLSGSIPAPMTINNNIAALEPGHYLIINQDGLRKKRYYDLRSAYIDTSLSNISEDEAVERVRANLIDTIKCHLVSDVPVGSFLSGGIDSSAIVALMREVGHNPVKTVSVVFPGTPYDEAKYARIAAKRFETEHVEIEVSGKNLADHLDKIMNSMDQPTVDGVNTYFVSWATAKAGLKVAMSGVGGDEVFGGYPSFSQIPKLYKYLLVLSRLPFGNTVARLALKNSNRSSVSKICSMISNEPSIPDIYFNYRSVFTKEQVQKLFHKDFTNNASEEIDPQSFLADCSGLNEDFNRVGLLETSSYMANQLLRDTDIFSMAHSLEVRVPFVDHTLIELLAKIPVKYKMRKNAPKGLLIKALQSRLPEEIVNRPKMGFTFPFDLWLRQDIKNVVFEQLNSSKLFNPSFIERILTDYSARKLHWSKIWGCFVLSKWVE